MTRDEKRGVAKALAEKIAQTDCFYILNAEGMNAEQVAEFRARCFAEGLVYQVAKNTLIEKALQNLDAQYGDTKPLVPLLKGVSSMLFALPEAYSTPAALIERFRKEKKLQKPLFKGAWVDRECIIGNDNLSALSRMKSKPQVLGELLDTLQSPLRNLAGALASGSHNLGAVMRALETTRES